MGQQITKDNKFIYYYSRDTNGGASIEMTQEHLKLMTKDTGNPTRMIMLPQGIGII